jgi:CHAD domain-containing protein
MSQRDTPLRAAQIEDAAQIKDALRRQIGEAVLGLKSADLSDEAIHSARKKLKSARARLRLLRAAVGRAAYKRENAALRDSARPLSAVRDSKVMLDTVHALLRRKGTRSRRVLLTALRGRMRQGHAAARGDFGAGHRAAVSVTALQRASQRIERWPVPKRATAALSRGVRRIYRTARKALKAVEAECSAENLHELRKQVKYLREALAAFENSGVGPTGKTIKRADALASVLGKDHDFYMLQENLAAAEASLHTRSASFRHEIAKRRDKLEKRALKKGRSLLRRKPRAFAKRVAA